MIIMIAQVRLGWVYLFMGIIVGSAVVPIILCMSWGRLTAVAMVWGSVGGTLLALITWLSVASTYDNGLSDFMKNTGWYTIRLFYLLLTYNSRLNQCISENRF